MDTTDRNAEEQWEFHRERAGVWRWRCRAANARVRTVSSSAFPTLNAAIEDAARHGFNYAIRKRDS